MAGATLVSSSDSFMPALHYSGLCDDDGRSPTTIMEVKEEPRGGTTWDTQWTATRSCI